jgi:hypothetical protein
LADSDHEILWQRVLVAGVEFPRNNAKRPTMPFLFWLPMILFSGMLSVAEDSSRVLVRNSPPRR